MITIAGKANSGTTLYALHQAIKYCKSRYNPELKDNSNNKPMVWIYSELTRNNILDKIDILYPKEIIAGELGCMNIDVSNLNLPFNLDSVIASALNWKEGDVAIVDGAMHTSISNEHDSAKEKDVIKFALESIQNGVIMFYREQIRRNDEIDYKASYKHNKFDWHVKIDDMTHYVDLIK